MTVARLIRWRGTKEYQAAIRQYGPRLFRAWRPRIEREMLSFATEGVAALFRGRPGLELHDFGRGMGGSFRMVTQGETLETYAAIVGTAHPGAALQEHGGQVTARRARMLAIPTKDALTGSGAKRYGSPLRSTLSDKETWVQEDDQGRLWLYLKKGTGKRVKPVAIARLVRSVNVPARLGFFRAWEGRQPERNRIAREAMAEALGGARG